MKHRIERDETAKKKRYVSPRLVVHGDLRRLTMAKRGTKNDGGGLPRTKVQTT